MEILFFPSFCFLPINAITNITVLAMSRKKELLLMGIEFDLELFIVSHIHYTL